MQVPVGNTLLGLPCSIRSPVIPAETKENTGHFTGHLEKKYRTYYRTWEADFRKFVSSVVIEDLIVTAKAKDLTPEAKDLHCQGHGVQGQIHGL